MNSELVALSITAASIGFLHTLFGPDHYLPFVVMSKARQWNTSKTALVTLLCGIGHIMSSVLLGMLGVIFGIAVMRLKAFEAFRGNLAAWALIGFGLAYFIWGMRKAFKMRPHSHIHVHEDNKGHSHIHSHHKDHAHLHGQEGKNITPWILFTIFVLGPCEPLIPVLMYPAAKMSLFGMVLVTLIFGAVTISTMLVSVFLLSRGIKFVPIRSLERYSHALAGATIFLCGAAIQFLGL